MPPPIGQLELNAAFQRRPEDWSGPRSDGMGAGMMGGMTDAMAIPRGRSLNKQCSLLLSLLLALLWRPAAAQVVLHHRETSAVGDSTQLLVVTTPAWNAQTGELQRYERSQPNAVWRAVGHAIGVVVGENGLGWEAEPAKPDAEDTSVEDSGFLTSPDPGAARAAHDPVKQEGDLRSPAGVFRLGPAFGRADQEPAGWRMPYWSLNPTTECINDPKSRFYNHVISRSAVPADWKSSEPMLGSSAFQWGLIIQQNVAPVRPGDGSCIFLNVWSGPGMPTAGCTATAEDQVKVLLGWLDPNQQPLLVQLPVAKYDSLEKVWGLPSLAVQRNRR